MLLDLGKPLSITINFATSALSKYDSPTICVADDCLRISLRMSAVFLNVGQCGIQLGQSFWQEVEEWTIRNFKESSRPALGGVRASAAGRLSGTQRSFSASKKSAYLPYSLLNGTLPCLWLDTEPKVVKSCCSNSQPGWSSFAPSKHRLIASESCMVLPERSGRGSNWAYGYHGGTRREKKSLSLLAGDDEGVLTVKSVEERMRKMVEKCDRFGGTVLMHSLAGGTGAGTYTSEL